MMINERRGYALWYLENIVYEGRRFYPTLFLAVANRESFLRRIN